MLGHLSLLSNVEIRDTLLSPRVCFKSAVLWNLGSAACKPPACGLVTGSFQISLEGNEPGVQAAEGVCTIDAWPALVSSTAHPTSDDK